MTYDVSTTLRYLRNSDIHGFYLRLKKYGFAISHSLISKNGYHSFVFDNNDTVCTISVKRHAARINIFGPTRLSIKCIGIFQLEKPFLKYFDDSKPLQIRRIINPQVVERLKLHQRKARGRREKE